MNLLIYYFFVVVTEYKLSPTRLFIATVQYCRTSYLLNFVFVYDDGDESSENKIY